jgi:signal transduction histidine kinase/ActR/RegA family two-component response regulator
VDSTSNDQMRLTRLARLRAHPIVASLCLLLLFIATFTPLHSRLGEGAFVLGNLFPLGFALVFGLRWGVTYTLVHFLCAVLLAGHAGFSFERLISNGIPSMIVTLLLSGALGRIRDLTHSLQRELRERRRYEQELQQHKAHLELLVAERTNELLVSNEQLRQEIAEHAQTETAKRDLENSLKRAEKMEAIGLLAGSVAHDLNNTLSCIVTTPELLLLELPEDSVLRDDLVSIRNSGKRAAEIVSDLLTMARRGITTRHVLDINDVLSTLLTSAELSNLKDRHPRVLVEAKLAAELVRVQGSPLHLSRAILNLVLNSMEAIEQGGRVTLSTRTVQVDEPAGHYERVPPGTYAAVTIEDDGTGIAPEDLDRIFEPFYTKKVMGRSGTGLGMAIVWGTVKDHSGFIDVCSEKGRGTTVTIFLPATQAQASVRVASAKLEDYRGQGQSVLIVDDLSVQRDLCTALLTKLGYTAISVASGEEAVAYVERTAVDLLVLDMIMDPGIDGLETYQRIVRKRPGQRAVITSGFSETERVQRAQALGAGAFIRKPYTIETLGVAVRDELRRRV